MNDVTTARRIVRGLCSILYTHMLLVWKGAGGRDVFQRDAGCGARGGSFSVRQHYLVRHRSIDRLSNIPWSFTQALCSTLMTHLASVFVMSGRVRGLRVERGKSAVRNRDTSFGEIGLVNRQECTPCGHCKIKNRTLDRTDRKS